VLGGDESADARPDGDGKPADKANGLQYKAVSGPLTRARANADASPTNTEGNELEEIYRAGAT